jgi:hypothetical protein
MACEAEQRRVDELSAEHAQKAAYASSICAAQGQASIECEGARGEANALLGELIQAKVELQKCLANSPPEQTSRLLEATGYVTFLRVNEPGGGYGGGSTNWFDADVIFKLHSRPDKGFGFQLRDDAAEPVRRGMLALLEDAIVNRLQVITDYVEPVATPNDNCFVIRVAITQTPPPHPPSTPGNIGNVMS